MTPEMPLLPRPLCSAQALRDRRAAEAGGRSPVRWVVFDCSFDLVDPAAGLRAYREGHLPGALHLDLNRDLSDTHRPNPATGRDPRGRHPMPGRDALAARFAALGVGPGRPVVVYDRQGGMFAARAWWLLRWLGHAEVAVLDGGLAAWRALGEPVPADDGPVPSAVPAWTPGAPLTRSIDADGVAASLGRRPLVDARAPERYRGETEPFDPVAGHIPGALNRPFNANLGPDGRFLPPDALRAAFDALLGPLPTEPVAAEARTPIVQCGSGVTACHHVLAMQLAGRGEAVLYPGSWSEWCEDPRRPVARGA